MGKKCAAESIPDLPDQTAVQKMNRCVIINMASTCACDVNDKIVKKDSLL